VEQHLLAEKIQVLVVRETVFAGVVRESGKSNSQLVKVYSQVDIT
jgi:hypothetical protein